MSVVSRSVISVARLSPTRSQFLCEFVDQNGAVYRKAIEAAHDADTAALLTAQEAIVNEMWAEQEFERLLS